MSLFSDIGDAVSSAVHDVGSFVEGAADVAGNVAKDMVESTVDGIVHTFDSPMSVLKGLAEATILSPYMIVGTMYELGSDIYNETDKEINKK
jgi:hypothetical protein